MRAGEGGQGHAVALGRVAVEERWMRVCTVVRWNNRSCEGESMHAHINMYTAYVCIYIYRERERDR